MDFKMSNFTEDRIELMDKVYNQLIDHFINRTDKANPSDTLYSIRYNIDRDLSQWVINRVAEIGHDIKVLISQRHGYGSYSIVRMIKVDAIDFQNSGGFTAFFRNKLSESKSQITINNYGDNNTYTVGDNNNISQ